MAIVLCSRQFVEETLTVLKTAGSQQKERLVLWLGQRAGTSIAVRQVIEPPQISGRDFFRIPRHSMGKIMNHLRKERLMIAAQVHTHPLEAFHSEADDRWAIVRHVGALSLVVPHFAIHTTPANFRDTASFYSLDSNNSWVSSTMCDLDERCQIHN